MIFNYPKECAHCRATIEPGQRWVREKIYEPTVVDDTPNYRRYHAELFAGQQLSCWEKHLVQVELHRIGYAA